MSEAPSQPGIDRSQVRVKAFAVLLHPDGARHAVSRMATSEHPTFHRPLGGSIELGETSVKAVRREIAEELDAEITGERLLGVLENIFTIEGELGHEVVFVYAASLTDPDVVPEGGRAFVDVDVPGWVEWRPLAGDPAVPLKPQGLQELLDREL